MNALLASAAQRIRQAFVIDLEMLAIFRVLLALVVLWGLVGRVSIRDYLFPWPQALSAVDGTTNSMVPTGGTETPVAFERYQTGPSSDAAVAAGDRIDSGLSRPLLYSSAESRQVWTPWHWSWLWMDQVVARIRDQMLSVQTITVNGVTGTSRTGPSDTGSDDSRASDRFSADGSVTIQPTFEAWNQPLLEMQRFFASRLWFDAVIGAGIACSLLLAVGLFTKTSNILLWMVVLSIQHRMPLFNSGGDSLERLFLFWLIFLPSGAMGSLDALWFPRQGFWRKRINQMNSHRDQTFASTGRRISAGHGLCSWATAAIMIQLVSIYFYSALEKWNDAAWWEGTAIAQSWQWGFIAKPLADTLWPQSGLWGIATRFVFGLELVLPLLVFLPGLFGWTRRVSVWVLVAMHLSIAATLSIGTFSAVCIVGWILFLPWPGSLRQMRGWSLRDARDRANAGVDWLAGSARPAATGLETAVALLLALTVWWNLASATPLKERLSFPQPLAPLLCQLGLDPHFPMFGRVPERDVHWVHRVTLPSGLEWDLREQLPSPLGLPQRIESWIEAPEVYYWRQLHVNLLYLNDAQPAFVGLVRENLRAVEWHAAVKQGLRTPNGDLVPADELETVHSELLMIDSEGRVESWSVTDL